ncbi:potassium channel regulatory protein [Anolis carolinensis]|uniref:Potassium channel regulator n=1 Tax=Anolis carolinensis TaxID=28377 RepID=G1KP72_ANOCA|nr:PREDICTED: potassium channel regulatory protein [Anolis carolinensis]|eukprot:XP_003215403.1 PREDICTED: potassium channel regulatory protein [Anolis carolinensis]
MNNQSVITLNVGGLKFITWSSTLQRFPESRLARMLNGNDPEFRLVNGIFFVDRDGVLFSYILDILRTLQISLPSDFSDYQRLQREAVFYELYPVADLLSQEHLLKSKLEILEIRFLLQETQAFFRVFGSCSLTISELAGRIMVFEEKLTGTSWKNHEVPSQKFLTPLFLEKPSHHDLVFQCGTDYNDQFVARYVSIKPDQRKLFSGANVLGLLIDILLREGFHLISTRTVSAEEKIECYCLERTRPQEALAINIGQTKRDTPEPQRKATQMHKRK